MRLTIESTPATVTGMHRKCPSRSVEPPVSAAITSPDFGPCTCSGGMSGSDTSASIPAPTPTPLAHSSRSMLPCDSQNVSSKGRSITGSQSTVPAWSQMNP